MIPPTERPEYPSAILIRREIFCLCAGPAGSARITGLGPHYPSTCRPSAFSALSLCPSRTVGKSPSPAASGSESRALSPRHTRFAVSVPRPGARAARELRHLTAVAGVSQSPAGRRGYGTLGHGLFPAAASPSFPLQCRDQPKIKKMFDQLLLVLGARNQM